MRSVDFAKRSFAALDAAPDEALSNALEKAEEHRLSDQSDAKQIGPNEKENGRRRTATA